MAIFDPQGHDYPGLFHVTVDKNKNKHMKTLKSHITVLLLIFALTGCTDLKDQNFDTIISDEFNASEDDVNSLIASAYIPWRELFNKWQSYFWAQEISTDQLVIPKRPWGWVDDGGY